MKNCPFCGCEATVITESEGFRIIGCSNRKSMLCPSPSMVIYPEKDGEYDYKWWNRRINIDESER